MTPEELNRTIEFIVETQARQAVKQEQDKEWAKGLLAQLAAQDLRLLEMIESQSRRIELEYQRLEETRRENRAAQERYEEFKKESQKRYEDSQKRSDQLRVDSEKRSDQLRVDSEKRNEEFQREALRLLHRILDRLTRNPNSKN